MVLDCSTRLDLRSGSHLCLAVGNFGSSDGLSCGLLSSLVCGGCQSTIMSVKLTKYILSVKASFRFWLHVVKYFVH